jgi:cysteine synthase
VTRATAARAVSRIADSPADLIGNTPLLEVPLPGMSARTCLLAKMEMFNPFASVKDRAALFMIRAAVGSGALPPREGTLVECSSGSMGISLAALCAGLGHRCIIVMPDNSTAERLQILRAFGADVELVPHQEGLPFAWRHAEQLQRSIPGAWLPHQDTNPANVRAHYATTGPEIWQACGKEIDVLVCGVGTGGTLTGVARYLKQHRDVHVVAVEPARSAVLSGGEAGPHGIPGIGAGYISQIMDLRLVDEVIAIGDEAAAATADEITRCIGLPVGISSGAAAHASRIVSHRARWAGATIVTVFPDGGDRYLSMAQD